MPAQRISKIKGITCVEQEIPLILLVRWSMRWRIYGRSCCEWIWKDRHPRSCRQSYEGNHMKRRVMCGLNKERTVTGSLGTPARVAYMRRFADSLGLSEGNSSGIDMSSGTKKGMSSSWGLSLIHCMASYTSVTMVRGVGVVSRMSLLSRPMRAAALNYNTLPLMVITYYASY